MTKMRRQGWDNLPRNSKLAACLWPDLVPKDIQAEMGALARNERKFSPLEGKVMRDNSYRVQPGAGKKPEEPRYVSPQWWDDPKRRK